MIAGFNNYFDCLLEKEESIQKGDNNYLNIKDTISWCKRLYKCINEKLANKNNTRVEIVEQKEKALEQAKITNDISDWAIFRYWDDMLIKYDLLERLVVERAYL